MDNTGFGGAVSQTNANSVWQQVLERLRAHVSEEAFATWLAPTRGVDIEHDVLTVEVPNSFFAEWLGQYYVSAINEAVEAVTGNGAQVIFRTGKTWASPVVAPPRRRVVSACESARLQERYTFENYIVAECNSFACAAAKAVAVAPGTKYNPLLIYGGVGLGKTHLLQAIGNFLARVRPSARIYYTPAESLFTELITAIGQGNTMDFKLKYRSQDLLLLDDVHYLVGKESLQEEVFHIFNHLHSKGKQIVFTSDRPVKEIPTLEERLSSRLTAGLVVDLQPPDLETRVAILRRKAEAEQMELPADVALFVATKVKTNIRQLEGCLIRLAAMASMDGNKLTVEMASRALRDLVPSSVGITREAIIQQVADSFGVTVQEIKGRARTQHVTRARQVTMYLYRTLLELSLKEIGGLLGNKDHTTVMHSVAKIEALRQTDPDFDEKLKQIALRISG